MNMPNRFVLIILLALSTSPAFADKLEAFKEANRYDEGCVTIPTTYSSERSACNSEGPNVHPWCDGDKGPVSCGSEEDTRRPKRDIDNAERKIADLKDKKSKAESNRSNAKTDEEKRKFEDEVKQLENEIYETEK